MKKPEKSSDDPCGLAVLAVFPDTASLDSFQCNDPAVAEIAVPQFVHFAYEQGLLARETEAELRNFIGQARPYWAQLPPGLTFADLMDRISGERSVAQLVDAELRPLCRRLGLPDAQPSMISRLRSHFSPNTRGKQNLLRLLAFWIGLNHPTWRWSFPALCQLGNTQQEALDGDPHHGVRLAFHLTGPGVLVETTAMPWLKQELARCTKELGLSYLGAHSLTVATATVFVDLPGLRGNLAEVTRCGRALRDAFALVHQVLVRWELNDSPPESQLVIAIATGAFASLDSPLQAMLQARLADGDTIRMTSQVRTFANLAELKVVFLPVQREVGLYAGDTLTVWIADSLWSHIYYAHVPSVERSLPCDEAALATFSASLRSGELEGNPLLAAAHRNPKNGLLVLEIAKACIAKGLLHEADAFLAIILANRPLHVVARTVRLMVRLNAALTERDFSVAWLAFQDALAEGRFILKNCQVENEEVFCELGQVHFCVARRLYNALVRRDVEAMRTALRAILASPPPADPSCRDAVRRLVLEHLREAEALFDQGRRISPSGQGNRSLHWSFRVKALVLLLEADEEACDLAAWPDQIIRDRHGVFRELAQRLFCNLGWAARLPPPGTQLSAEEQLALFLRIHQAFERYDNTVLAEGYRATIHHAFAMLLYDFAPALSVGLLQIILERLRHAESLAASIAEKPHGIRSVVTCCSLIEPAQTLLDQVRGMIRFLGDHYGEALAQGDDALLPAEASGRKFLLDGFANEVLVDRRALLAG